MVKKTISARSLQNNINTDDILGKEVIDVAGRIIGVVEKILINPTNLEILGLEIDRGFLKKGLSVGKNYIDRVSSAAVFLKIKVVYEYVGMQVFDNLGEKVGRVLKVDLWRGKNKVKRLHVSRGFLKKEIIVSNGDIELIGANIFLSMSKEELVLREREKKS